MPIFIVYGAPPLSVGKTRELGGTAVRLVACLGPVWGAPEGETGRTHGNPTKFRWRGFGKAEAPLNGSFSELSLVGTNVRLVIEHGHTRLPPACENALLDCPVGVHAFQGIVT